MKLLEGKRKRQIRAFIWSIREQNGKVGKGKVVWPVGFNEANFSVINVVSIMRYGFKIDFLFFILLNRFNDIPCFSLSVQDGTKIEHGMCHWL